MGKLSKFYLAKTQHEKEIALKQMEVQLSIQKMSSVESIIKSSLSGLLPNKKQTAPGTVPTSPFKQGMDLFQEIRLLFQNFKLVYSKLKGLKK